MRTLCWLANRISRAVLSLVCAILASVIVSTCVIAFNYEQFSQSLTSWAVFIRGAVLVITIAWVVTLPLALLISRFDGWRFWFLAASGTAVGPALLIVLNLCIRFAKPSETFSVVDSWKVELVVTVISLTATALYLATLKRSIHSHNCDGTGCVTGK
jgi:predicted MFS family arabinose efflux permease